MWCLFHAVQDEIFFLKGLDETLPSDIWNKSYQTVLSTSSRVSLLILFKWKLLWFSLLVAVSHISRGIGHNLSVLQFSKWTIES